MIWNSLQGSLQMDFQANKNFTDASFAALWQNLPPRLLALCTDMRSSQCCTDAALTALAEHMPSDLMLLHLVLCGNFTDESLCRQPGGLNSEQTAMWRFV